MNILITGGTGTLGQKLIHEYGDHNVTILSRNETRQLEVREKFSDHSIKFISGDISCPFAVQKATLGQDLIFHCAANKHVDLAESAPYETTKVNIIGSKNIIDAAIRNGVQKVVGISTDKACSPINVYGISKRMMEKMFIEADLHNKNTDFYVVRYGNVLHSAGSVTTKWKELANQISKQKIKVTNPTMRRFYFTVHDAVRLIKFTLDNQLHGKIIMEMMKSLTLKQLASQFCKVFGCQQKVIDVRPGEKQAEQLIADYEVPFAYQSLNDDYMMIDEQHCALPGWRKRHSEYNTMNCDDFSDQDVYNMIHAVCT